LLDALIIAKAEFDKEVMLEKVSNDLKFETKTVHDRFDNLCKRIKENDFGSASCMELSANEDEEKKDETEKPENEAEAPEVKKKEKAITTHVE